MKVLIVSFDKTLTESLKNALSDHEVFIAKNSEEAIKMIPSDIEVVVYDAISGAISEEDINTLYTKKFSNARYLILYDELFPVDMNNIIAPAKILVTRDESPENIKSKLTEIPTGAPATQTVEEVTEPPQEEPVMEIEPTSLTAGETPEAVPEEPGVQDIPQEAEMEIEPASINVEEVAQEAAQMVSEIEAPQEPPPAEPQVPAPQQEAQQQAGGKVLIVSFDQTLIDSIRGALGGEYEIESVKTVRQAMQRGTDASVVIFDAISGVIAEKGLIDLSNDQYMKEKPYIILVDDLFPINVDGIPLEKKESLSRDTDPSRIREIISRVAAPPAAPTPEPVSEAPVQEIQPEQEAVIEEVTEETIQEQEPEVGEPVAEPEAVTEAAEEEQEEIPALEALGKIIESQKKETAPPQPSHVEVSADLEKILEEKMTQIREMIADMVRKEIERAFEELDIQSIIKETAYRVLRERLEEIIS